MTNETNDMTEVLRKERLYVIILAAIQIAHILDFVIMMPLGPRFMDVFNISPVEFSTLVAAYTFSAGIAGFFAALYADHFDRRNFLLFNFVGFIVGTFMCAIAPNFASLLIARVVAGAFGGILNACVLSLVSDLIPLERRGRAMGVVMSAFSITSVIGVPLGLFISQMFDWHAPFYMICILGVIFWIASYIYLPSVKVREVKMTMKENLKNFKSILIQRDYLQSFLFTSFLAFAVFMIVPFISPFVVNNIGLAEKDLPYLYLVGGAFTIITARIIGKSCDRYGNYKVFLVSTIISVIPILLLTFLLPVPKYVAILVTSFFMLSGTARFIPAMTLISAVVKPKERGTFMSLENAIRQLTTGVASQVAGLIIGTTAAGQLTNFPTIGILATVTTLLAIYFARVLKTKYQLR